MANYIRQWRKARGFSSGEALAKAIEAATGHKTDKTQISKLERGQRKITESWLNRIAAALDCNPGALLSPPPEGDLPPLSPTNLNDSLTKIDAQSPDKHLETEESGDMHDPIGRLALSYMNEMEPDVLERVLELGGKKLAEKTKAKIAHPLKRA